MKNSFFILVLNLILTYRYTYTFFLLLPLTNDIIIKLNEITTMIQDKSNLSSIDEDFIKNTFIEILRNGANYDVDEIEFWFENEGSWHEKKTRVRIMNMAQYLQTKYQMSDKFRMISDDDSCSCGN